MRSQDCHPQTTILVTPLQRGVVEPDRRTCIAVACGRDGAHTQDRNRQSAGRPATGGGRYLRAGCPEGGCRNTLPPPQRYQTAAAAAAAAEAVATREIKAGPINTATERASAQNASCVVQYMTTRWRAPPPPPPRLTPLAPGELLPDLIRRDVRPAACLRPDAVRRQILSTRGRHCWLPASRPVLVGCSRINAIRRKTIQTH